MGRVQAFGSSLVNGSRQFYPGEVREPLPIVEHVVLSSYWQVCRVCDGLGSPEGFGPDCINCAGFGGWDALRVEVSE